MTTKPLLFSDEMVRALLDGRKTQTRRVVKPQPVLVGPETCPVLDRPIWCHESGHWPPLVEQCPYGRPGDLLWVRECWCEQSDGFMYRAGMMPGDRIIWRPSIFMPRRASRLTLRLTDVRVQRAQDISHADCIAEGIARPGPENPPTVVRDEFTSLWDSINANRGYGWGENPWVWALTFDVLRMNVDEMSANRNPTTTARNDL